ncbi:MAG: fibronectin type III domain-containing protein, partial [Chitinophagaceae bacterium]
MKCSSKYCLVILFFIQTATYSQTIADSVITYETADGLTLLLNKQILFSDNKEGITEIEIWKRTNQKWVSIGKLLPIENWLTIKQAVDTVKITYFMQQKKLSSDADAWLFLRNHPLVSLEEYGPIGTNVLFLEKCGLVFTDKKIHSASADSFIQYKISYKKKGADITKEVSYKKTINPPMDKPLFLKAKETDSLIAITWAAKLQLNTEPFIAQVYQAVGSTNNFKPTKKIWSKQTEKGDSVYYYFSDKVLPNIQYSYFLQTIHPNGEKSTLSDTVTLFAANFSKISSVNNVKIIDTTDGLLLKWDTLQNNNLLIGIVIQRSSDNGQNYFPIDTIATSAVKYFDATVLPGVKYHYSIDLLTIRRNLIISPVKLMSIYSAKLATAPPPVGLTAKGFNDSIVLNWNKVNDKHFYAFWVYRSTAGDSVWQKISNELKENYYTDTSIHNSNIVYKYAVRCVNQQLKPSVFSVPAYATVTNKMKPLSVIGLKAFYDGIESFLSWKPNFSFENDVKGYIVYR